MVTSDARLHRAVECGNRNGMAPYLTLRERHERTLDRYRHSVEALKPALAAYARAHGGAFILFGSAGRGTPHDQSDVDILADFPLTAENSAWAFAEDTCWALQLKPHVHLMAWVAERVVVRAREVGVVLR
jgi:predicted nucleotidyltransferase